MKLVERRDGVLVSTEWLAGHLNDPTLRVLDCRYYFDRSGLDAYRAGHLPGASHLNWEQDISDPLPAGPYPIAAWKKVADSLERLGVSDDTLLVAYDDEGGHYSSRLWFTLARYGHADHVRIVEGGWTKWVLEGRPTTTTIPEVALGHLTRRPERERPGLFVDAETVLAALDDPRAVVADVRRLTEYSGEEVRARHGGHVPGATHLFWQDNLDWEGDRTFRDEATLRRRYEAAGATSDKRIITYCQGGVRACHSALTLLMLGYPDVRVYVGSWAEWGNRDDLPREMGTEHTDAG